MPPLFVLVVSSLWQWSYDLCCMFGQAFPREVIVLGADVKQRAAGMTNPRQQIINALMNAASKDATGDVAMVGAGDVEAAPAASSSTGEAGAKTTAKAVVDFGDIPDVGPAAASSAGEAGAKTTAKAVVDFGDIPDVGPAASPSAGEAGAKTTAKAVVDFGVIPDVGPAAASSAGDAAPTEEADVETTTQPAYFGDNPDFDPYVGFGDIPDVGPAASSSAGGAAPTEVAAVETTTQTVVDGPARLVVIEAVDDIADHTPSPASLAGGTAATGGANGSPAATGSLMETALARATLMHMLRTVRGLINEHPELMGMMDQNLEPIRKNLDDATGP